jgi:kumamolisin
LAILLAPTFVFAASPSRDPEVALSGNTVAGLNQATRIADEDAGKIIDVQLALKLRNRAQLDDLIRRVSTPGSPEYGHYLTPAQFDAQFGPTAAQVDQATAFLRANGLQVTAAAPGSTLVDARGTVGQAEAALHTGIGRFHDRAGHDYFANDTEPSLPASLASFVTGVQGLNNRYLRHHSAIQPRVCPPTCAGTPYTPTQLRTGFGLATAPLTTLTGTGQTLGLLELDDFQQANIDGYDTAYSLPALTPQRQVVDFGSGISNAGEIEVELDIEVMHALAPGAPILVFEGPNSDLGVNDTYGCMVNPNAGTSNGPCPNHASGITAPSNSTSWGLCEPLQMLAETNTLGAIFAQGAAQGQSFFAASGDTGAYDCYPDTSGIWVDSPASDPDVTGVGGTKLFLNPDNTYNSETAWPGEPQPYYGSGGGKSIYFTRPSWQTGPGVITTGGAPRQVPDVSLDADPLTGYSVYTCLSTSISCTGSGAGFRGVGGTSAGAPAWAAFTAIYNQYATCQGKSNLGFANPTLSSLGSNAQTFTPFNDVTTGDNKEGTALGYSAGANYDMVTGWGTLRAAGLAQDVAGIASSRLLLSSVAPNTGGTAGGNTVTLAGCGFVNKPTVTVGGTTLPGNSVQFLSTTSLQATMPPHALGTVQVTVTNLTGPPSNSVPYTYLPPLLVAAVGADNTPYEQQDLSGWTSLGGGLIAAPAVVSVPSQTGGVGAPIYIGLGGNHDLYVRTAAQGWRPLDDLPVYCIDNPGATIIGSTLTIACQGGDHGLFLVQGPVPAQDVPPSYSRSSWQAAGGILTAGPAVANVPGRGLEVMVVGGSNHVYEYYAGSYHASGFLCSGHTALATNPGLTLAYFACHALDNSLWWAQTDAAHGGNWFGASSLGGLIIDGPAIAATSLGPTFFVEGLDHGLLHRGQSGGYTYDGGYIQYGTGAAALF